MCDVLVDHGNFPAVARFLRAPSLVALRDFADIKETGICTDRLRLLAHELEPIVIRGVVTRSHHDSAVRLEMRRCKIHHFGPTQTDIENFHTSLDHSSSDSVSKFTARKAHVAANDYAPGTKKFILGNISSRMAEMIVEEIKEAGNVKRKDADEAQAEIIKTIRELELAGEITLIKDEED